MLNKLIIALCATVLSTAAYAGNCTTNTPLSLFDNGSGSNHILTDNQTGYTPGDGSVVGQIAGPQDDGSGTANLTGSASCPEYDPGDALAIAAALSTPIWLETASASLSLAALASPMAERLSVPRV